VRGEDFIFFRPVFNMADSSITVGIISILIFHRKFFEDKHVPAIEEIVDEENKIIDTEEKEFDAKS